MRVFSFKLLTGDRPHHCETCGKQFRDPHSLRLHQKRHTGIGLHTCTECGKDFTNPFHLKRHLRIHSGTLYGHCAAGGGYDLFCF